MWHTNTAFQTMPRDGLFVDDTHGLGTEHNQMVKRCGMTPNEVADWNKKSLAAYTSSFQQVVGRVRIV